MSLESGKLVSVIVPVFNVEEFLTECIDSILSQSYKNLEIILVDDGSKDSSGSICDKYAQTDSRIKVVHKENGGLSSARNAGIENATGEYIIFVDSDDVIETKAVENLLNAILRQGCPIVRMNMTSNFEELGNSSNINTIKKNSAEDYLKKICTYRGSVSFCDKIFLKSVFHNYRFKLGVTNEDLLLFSTILIENKYDVFEIDYNGYYYRKRENSITSKKFGKSIQDSVENCEYLLELSSHYMPEISPYFCQLILYQAMCYFIQMPKSYIKEKNIGYLKIFKIFKENKEHIKGAFFSFKFKMFIRLCILSPKTAKRLVAFLKM